MTAPDHYAVLGVARTAGDDEVRAAYRARSMLLHPDLHEGRPDAVRREADRAMAQLTDAYQAILAERGSSRGRPDEPDRARTAGSPEPPLHRLGRAAARSRLARLAAEAGEKDGGFAYRLGWLVGRRRSG
ncbi:MAG TPA: J domain-containing protein [Acidimicrobiales bacterium]|nr:J domain-containing protein [Acidimicrobiales bacterium]